MPSPVGHTLGGLAVYLGGTKKKSRPRLLLVITLLGSLVPDFDFLPGLWVGHFSAFHHGISHSLLFAVLFALIVFFSLRWTQRSIAKQAAILAGLSYGAHVILDFVGTNEGTRGVPLFWPFSDELFGLNLGLLGYFYYTDNGIWSVMRWDNVPALLRELLIIGVPVLFLLWREGRSKYSSVMRLTSERKDTIDPCL